MRLLTAILLALCLPAGAAASAQSLVRTSHNPHNDSIRAVWHRG